MQQQKATEAQVTQWIAQYGKPGSGRLERPELEQLLEHLHPETGRPDTAALDRLVCQATEVRVHGCHLRGDPNASIPTPQPVVMRPMFGAFGKAVGPTSIAFVSQAAAAAGYACARMDPTAGAR